MNTLVIHFLPSLKMIYVPLPMQASAGCLLKFGEEAGGGRNGNVVYARQDEEAIRLALSKLLDDADTVQAMFHGPNPFGEGRCSETILKVFRDRFGQHDLLLKQLTY